MPELPEVQQAVKLIRSFALNRVVANVETTEDAIVFDGVSHTQFAEEVKGRRVIDANRYGKQFYIELEGKGRMPVLHLGMTGFLQVKGKQPHQYARKIKDTSEWPPRFMKFVMGFDAMEGNPETFLAFCDARRLGKIRLRESPLEEPPISSLGFDPLLSMPSREAYSTLVSKRKSPIKALLLDQSFNAGVGNWVADEILYHSGVHPERRCHTLTQKELERLHENTKYVCQTAVDVDADSSRFPAHWLFGHRWGKGKKDKPSFILPSGERGTIKWMKVGGRTSAYVAEVQQIPKNVAVMPSSSKKRSKQIQPSEESDLTSLSDGDTEQITGAKDSEVQPILPDTAPVS